MLLQYFKTEEVTFGSSVEFPEDKKEASVVHEGRFDPSEKKLQTVERDLNDLTRQHRFFDWRKTKRNEGFISSNLLDVTGIGWKSLYIAIGESIIVLGLSIWEVYYIKKMLDFRQAV